MNDTAPAARAESANDMTAESLSTAPASPTADRVADIAAALARLGLADPADAPALADGIATALAARLEAASEPESFA